MKILILILGFFPIFNFAQDKSVTKTEIKINDRISKSIKEPTFMVNDSIVDRNLALKLNLDLIKNIIIVKDDPKYPDGLVKITYKYK
ncbi:hypothetical protein [Faecalibacter bovis]|uniref:POTRA domain-containing protein n=1 Tax=Faecalibacter bovis TaxID=2898187 RepID=A0ABX7XCA3_9FLAO|nr:hypothetical protein [Faecalibacter bovis]QTV05417.1 hypothetical protein J9309_11675 [Faecalibacter bovis]